MKHSKVLFVAAAFAALDLVSCGSESGSGVDSYGSVSPSSVITGQLVDARDGNVYRTVTIGSQTWMAENLRFNNISGSTPDNYFLQLNAGNLYSWSAIMDSAGLYSSNGLGCGSVLCDGYGADCDLSLKCKPTYPVRGICPEGWHVPDTTEWLRLYNAVGNSPYALQSDSISSFLNDNGALAFPSWSKATNAYGFSLIPTENRRAKATLATSTVVYDDDFQSVATRLFTVKIDTAFFALSFGNSAYYHGVRCVKD